MTIEEWYALDKKPGMRFRTPDGKVGKLVSVHKDGATLDFTDEETYARVHRSFYRCVQLKHPEEEYDPPQKPKYARWNGDMHGVYCTMNGLTYSGVRDAARALGISIGDVRDACEKHVRIAVVIAGRVYKTNLEWLGSKKKKTGSGGAEAVFVPEVNVIFPSKVAVEKEMHISRKTLNERLRTGKECNVIWHGEEMKVHFQKVGGA